MKITMCLGLVGLMVAAAGCISATVADGVCDTQTVDFGTMPKLSSNTPPSVSVLITLPPQSITMDLSKDITQLDKVADQLQATISSLMISNTSHDLDWARSVDVEVSGSASDGSTPQAKLGNGKFTAPGSELNLNVVMDTDTVLHYLQSGSITLLISVSGEVNSTTIPSGELTNDVQLCANVSGHFSK